jgi:thiamine-monophosphate kinase
MALDEFGLIETFFRRPAPAAGVRAGIGDDGALLAVDPAGVLAITTDTLVADVHFPVAAAAFDIGQRALRVNLSDLAAMGAVPRWCLLALTLPAADPDWLAAFSAGLFVVADAHGCALVGGDTTRGPLALTITALGEVPADAALRRSGACEGDWVFVTGELGGAAAALAQMTEAGSCRAADADLNARYWYPEPRVREGVALRLGATAMTDISDGLVADLGHIAAASGVDIDLRSADIDVPAQMSDIGQAVGVDPLHWVLTGGEDHAIVAVFPRDVKLPARWRVIGEVRTPAGRTPQVTVDGAPWDKAGGWDHFGDEQ